MATLEKVYENIITDHFDTPLFNPIRNWLTDKEGVGGGLSLCDLTSDYPIRKQGVEVARTMPDKYISDDMDCCAVVDFKVGSRGKANSRKEIIKQMRDYGQLFDMPVVLIQAIKWDSYNSELRECKLIEGEDIFIFDCPFQDVIALTFDGCSSGCSHATFAQTENVYLLDTPGIGETDTSGLIWPKNYKEVCLPLQGLTRGEDPYLHPFPTEKSKQRQYEAALNGGDSVQMMRLNTSFGERVRAENGRVVWPFEGLKDELMGLV